MSVISAFADFPDYNFRFSILEQVIGSLPSNLTEEEWIRPVNTKGGAPPNAHVVSSKTNQMHADESPAAELWRRTLSQIPAVFGRLVYLASLRDPNTGIYQHFGFAQRFTGREADKTMRRSHANAFADWLSLSVEEQKRDLDRYLAGLDGEKTVIVSNWSQFPPFANFLPMKIREAERELFLSDMKVIMELLRVECSGALSHPGASRRR